MYSIKDLPLKSKILYYYIAYLLLPLLIVYLVTTFYTSRSIQSELQVSLRTVSSALNNIFTATAEESAQQYLRAAGDHSLQTVTVLHGQYLQGALTLDEAQWLARDILLSQQIAETGYIFASDSTGKVLFKPAKQTDDTTLEHSPENTPTPDKNAAKPSPPNTEINYSVHFKPWDWVLNIVCNTNELIQAETLSVSEAILGRIHFDQPHQIFIRNSNGQILLKSWPDANIPEAKRKEFSEVLARSLGDAEDHFTYQWQEFGQYEIKERIAYYSRLPVPGLLVGVSAYTSDLQDVLLSAKRTVLLTIILTFLGTVVTAFLVSSSITKPLKDFIGRITETEGKQNETSLNVSGFGEISSLTTCFNRYMLIIKGLNEQLSEEMETSDSIHQQLRHEVVDRKDALEQLQHEVATRKSAETYLQLFKNIFDNAIEGIVITDKDARILAVNQSFTDITGYSAQEAMGENPRMLSSGKHDQKFYNTMWQTLQEKGSWSGEIWNKNKMGNICPEWLSISEIKDDQGRLTNYFAFFHDISELKKKEKQISFMAYRDALTKLPNRAALEHRLSKAISQATRKKVKLAVFFIDLDNFKKVNDSLGHDKGDQLLIQVSQRMTKTIRAEDTLSRLGGDEFILLSENIEHESSVYILANRILESFRQPIHLDSRKIYINASLGISIFPNDGDTPPELIKNADMAMYKAKSEGRNKFVLFTQEMNEKLKTNIRIENSIRTGLKNKEFVVFYQPKINLSTEQTTSFEALIRWKRGGQIIGPNKFIPVAEESGLIDEMSLYVLEDVCAFLSSLKVRNLELPISVNISPRTFNNPEIVDSIDKILSKHNIAHKLIDFEITETTAMKDVDHTLKVMRKFRERGTSFSIDDFGTGYSSLSYLREMPVSTLKIDKRFIDVGDPNSMSIVSSIVAMSQEMQLKVVAEGAETSGQLRWLKSIGCDEVQGYIFSRPMPELVTLEYLLSKNELQVTSVLNGIADTF